MAGGAGADGRPPSPRPRRIDGRPPSQCLRRIDPWAGQGEVSDNTTDRGTRAPPGRRAANPGPCPSRVWAVARSAVRTPPSCSGNSRPPAMQEVPRRPGLRQAAGSATSAAGSRPVGCRWTGGERHDERAEEEAEAAKDSPLAKEVAAEGNRRQTRCRASVPCRQSMNGGPLIWSNLVSSVELERQRLGVS